MVMIPKFRAWHKEKKQMYEVKGISYPLRMINLIRQDIYLEDLKVSFDDVVVMQSTGLFDKNGVEIYAGDIIGKTGITLVLGIHCLGGLFSTKRIGSEKMFLNVFYEKELETELENLRVELLKCEVIGNIYKNSELLQETA